MNSSANKKRPIPIKKIKISQDKVVDLTPMFDHVRINQKVKLQIMVNFADNVFVRIEPIDSRISIKNNETIIKQGIGIFSNLRFTKSSGRGNKIDLKIYLRTNPEKNFVCKKFIKITRDGPRNRKSTFSLGPLIFLYKLFY